MGFNMLFDITFGTNLLIEGPVPVSVFLPILGFRGALGCFQGI